MSIDPTKKTAQQASPPRPTEGSTLKAKSDLAEVKELIKSLIAFIAIALMIRGSVVEAFKIPSESMMPTLEIGDHILVNKLSYGLWLPFCKTSITSFSVPRRKDVVVFTRPDDASTTEDDESDTNIIKRVVGLPGDIIEVRGTKVFINGSLFSDDDQYAVWVKGGTKDFGPVQVPPGKVLLLGDNRDQSKDSRFWDDHFLDVRRIKGRAFGIYFNFASPKRMFSSIK